MGTAARTPSQAQTSGPAGTAWAESRAATASAWSAGTTTTRRPSGQRTTVRPSAETAPGRGRIGSQGAADGRAGGGAAHAEEGPLGRLVRDHDLGAQHEHGEALGDRRREVGRQQRLQPVGGRARRPVQEQGRQHPALRRVVGRPVPGAGARAFTSEDSWPCRKAVASAPAKDSRPSEASGVKTAASPAATPATGALRRGRRAGEGPSGALRSGRGRNERARITS